MQPELTTPWNKVDVTVHYLDRGEPGTMTVTIDRLEMLEQERQEMRDNARGYSADVELAATWADRADNHDISDGDFKARVLQGAAKLATTPIQLPGRLPGAVRILPPWAVREVVIEPTGLANILTLA